MLSITALINLYRPCDWAVVWVCRGPAGVFVTNWGCPSGFSSDEVHPNTDLRSGEFSLSSSAFWKEGEIESTA